MKTMEIYEPAMCCPTGICGVGVDPELLRIATVLNNLEKNGVKIERYNLSGNPDKFIENQVVNDFLNVKGVEGLPLILIDGKEVLSGKYPSNDDIIRMLDVPKLYLGTTNQKGLKIKVRNSNE